MQAEPVPAAQQTLLFDPVNGIGLTLLRIGIESVSGTSVIMGNAGLTDGPGAVTLVRWQSVGGALVTSGRGQGERQRQRRRDQLTSLTMSDYEAWATTLAAFPAYYKAQTGVDLYAISAQNEPDFNATYEACLYSASQMVSFIDVLGPKLAALNPPVKVLAAEPDNWGNLWGGDGYGPAILADSMATSFVDRSPPTTTAARARASWRAAVRRRPRTTRTISGRRNARRGTPARSRRPR